jgi:hypothetical protein
MTTIYTGPPCPCPECSEGPGEDYHKMHLKVAALQRSMHQESRSDTKKLLGGQVIKDPQQQNRRNRRFRN